jgi:hypothetical protein
MRDGIEVVNKSTGGYKQWPSLAQQEKAIAHKERSMKAEPLFCD